MKLTGNTIFITGGGSGIGRGLAEALHKRGNKVIISGRRKQNLQETLDANAGMDAVSLDVNDPQIVKETIENLIKRYPSLNVVINNAGIMQLDAAEREIDDEVLVSTVSTNLLAPIRVTSAFIDHLKKQPNATIAYVSSVLAFVPLAGTAVYSATKAAVHSYAMSQRYKLRNTSVEVLEIAPPWVRTDLLNSREEERAMPLDDFIAQTMTALETASTEVLVEAATGLRNNPGPQEHGFVNQFNDLVADLNQAA
ncbi:short-chain dehydrogenase, teichoic and lipoteichoic acid D-alanine esterification [Rhizobium sp. CF122]|uniref:SDR family oxidoreductase n=1 Tax=Rhizobium sp. CF122 TaxID=1144312 RepID=UPI000271B9D9|nr:SDR family NAD(P)-dependent oxidoreductase [Rhizobium sp. CF122]EJL57830.1 short-chain dehydrogenase, teichoic and lipoteichoic acid D-alanine esterification [Rhizobium sp. CF122]